MRRRSGQTYPVNPAGGLLRRRPLRVARGLERIALVPVGPGVPGSQLLAHGVQQLQVFGDAVEAPALVDLVAGLVVAARVVLADQLAGLRATFEQVAAALGIEGRHAGLGEVEVVGAEVEAARRRSEERRVGKAR